MMHEFHELLSLCANDCYIMDGVTVRKHGGYDGTNMSSGSRYHLHSYIQFKQFSFRGQYRNEGETQNLERICAVSRHTYE